jgi:catechol 2,3-dioxygenase-like lactoylglutathione lyase family enzyme
MHHVQVAMPEGGEADARAFYVSVLGFVEIPKPESLAARGGVWFRTGNLDLHIGVEPDFMPAKKAHIAYLVDDLAAMRERLEAAGYAITLDVPLTGFDRLHTTDAFGNRVELLTPER